MRRSAVKITTAAVCTAIAVIMCVATAYLPLSIMPLYVAAFCIFLACKRGSLPYGILCAVASALLMFAMTGLSVKWLFFVLMFVPYGILTYFIHRFTYFKPKTGVIRGAISILFFNATFGIVYLIATRVLTGGIDLDLSVWVGKIGGYPILALVATLVLVPLDFIFSAISLVVLKRIPSVAVSRRERGDENSASDQSTPERKYDIFGYEIFSKEADSDSAVSDDKAEKKDDSDDESK